MPPTRFFCRWCAPSPGAAGIEVDTSDISVAARILAEFSDLLPPDDQKVTDNLGELGKLTQDPDTNIIKLPPNISASVPQLLAAIKELREKGYDLPEFPPGTPPKNEEEQAIRDRYTKCLAALSTRSCARATPTAAPPRRPSRSTRASTRTAWASGRWRRAPTSRTCARATSTTVRSR